MKHVLILAVVVLSIFSCSKPDSREPFLGEWKVVSTNYKGGHNPKCVIEQKGRRKMRWDIVTHRTSSYTLSVHKDNPSRAKSSYPGIPILAYVDAELSFQNDTLHGVVTSHTAMMLFKRDTFVMVRP